MGEQKYSDSTALRHVYTDVLLKGVEAGSASGETDDVSKLSN